MKPARDKDENAALLLRHSQAAVDGTSLSFPELKGYDSPFRKEWPDYRRSSFTLACALDRTEIVRMLIVTFSCASYMEGGLVLVDEDGEERDWAMTGFDLTIEFGCLATLELLCKLGSAHPDAVYAVEYSGLSHDECRALCKKNTGNRLHVESNPADALEALRHYTTRECLLKCDFCAGNT